jgi:hypothetical protein
VWSWPISVVRVDRVVSWKADQSRVRSARGLSGGPNMKSRCGIKRRARIGLASLITAMVTGTTSQAQPGFGPDPFWPYNNQYTPYSFPVGPASPGAGQGTPLLPRSGLNGSNQFQNYLDEMGAVRSSTERYGIGQPYYRNSVTPELSERLKREYRPNAAAEATFENTQQEVTDLYLAYFTERDPKKRAALLRQYQQARRAANRSLSLRQGSVARSLERQERLQSETGMTMPSEERSGAASSARRSGVGSSRSGDIGPPPPVSAGGSSRSRQPSGRTPTEVYNRAERVLGRDERGTRSSSPSTSNRRSNRRTIPPPPPLD